MATTEKLLASKAKTKSKAGRKKAIEKPQLVCLIHPTGIIELPESKFYVAKGENIYSKIGKILVCKDCCARLFQDYYLKYNDEKLATYYTCRKLDIAFVNGIYESAYEESGKTWNKIFGLYMKTYSSLGNVNGVASCFDNSEDYNMTSEEVDDENNIADIRNVKLSKKKLTELQDKYGYGFEAEEYLNFEIKYKKLSIGYKEKTALHTERLITYIIHKVKEEMATAKGEVSEAEKWAKIAQKDAQDAKLNVSQLSKSDITGGVDLLPQLVEAVEEMVSVIPIMPKLKTIPYDDVDMNIYALVNYYRRLEDKPAVKYEDVWRFYDEFFSEHFGSQGYTDEQLDVIKKQRNSVFKDLGEVYVEPLYFQHHDLSDSGDEDE